MVKGAVPLHWDKGTGGTGGKIKDDDAAKGGSKDNGKQGLDNGWWEVRRQEHTAARIIGQYYWYCWSVLDDKNIGQY